MKFVSAISEHRISSLSPNAYTIILLSSVQDILGDVTPTFYQPK